jgi:hypothetical protein
MRSVVCERAATVVRQLSLVPKTPQWKIVMRIADFCTNKPSRKLWRVYLTLHFWEFSNRRKATDHIGLFPPKSNCPAFAFSAAMNCILNSATVVTVMVYSPSSFFRLMLSSFVFHQVDSHFVFGWCHQQKHNTRHFYSYYRFLVLVCLSHFESLNDKTIE